MGLNPKKVWPTPERKRRLSIYVRCVVHDFVEVGGCSESAHAPTEMLEPCSDGEEDVTGSSVGARLKYGEIGHATPIPRLPLLAPADFGSLSLGLRGHGIGNSPSKCCNRKSTRWRHREPKRVSRQLTKLEGLLYR